MRVVIDGTPLVSSKLGGIGYYCKFLVENLLELSSKEDYAVLYNKSKVEHKQRVRIEEKYVSYPYRNFFRYFGPHFLYNMPLEHFLGPFDVYHGTDTRLLPTRHGRSVITVHDLEYLHSPETMSVKDIQKRIKSFSYSIKNADWLIAVSESTKRDMIRYYDVDPDRIEVTYLAAHSRYHPIDRESRECALVQEKYHLPRHYLLYVGGFYLRKNIPNMLRAFAAVKRRTQCPHQFVMTGVDGAALLEIQETIRELRLEKEVRMLGYVEELELPVIMTLADLFLQVSKFEGFGLPPLEAMQCGVPVLVSTIASLPEVVGDAGLQAHPDDVEDMSRKMEQVICDERVAQSLSAKGMKQAKKFTWRKTAENTLRVYQKCLYSKG